MPTLLILHERARDKRNQRDKLYLSIYRLLQFKLLFISVRLPSTAHRGRHIKRIIIDWARQSTLWHKFLSELVVAVKKSDNEVCLCGLAKPLPRPSTQRLLFVHV